MAGKTFTFWARIEDVHDGDTLYGDVDQGIGIHNRGKSPRGLGLRLFGCNARELSMPGGPEARANLAALIPVGSELAVVSRAWDRESGRIDVSITLPDGSDLVETLIAGQWAAAWDGTGTKPVPPWPRTVA